MKKMLIFVVVMLFSLNVLAKKDKQGVIKVQGGTAVTSLGVALDASYDRQLDELVPKHKILTIAITNNSIDMIQLDKAIDKWWVVDSRGSKHSAIIDLRGEEPDVYAKLPEKLKKLIEYPLLIQVGETKPIDLVFKDGVKLDSFKSVRFESMNFGRTFEIIARE